MVYNFLSISVIRLLKKGVDPNTSTPSGTTLLHRCCVLDNYSAAEILISHSADVNAQDEDMWCPLHVACALDNAEMLQLLLLVSFRICFSSLLFFRRMKTFCQSESNLQLYEDKIGFGILFFVIFSAILRLSCD